MDKITFISESIYENSKYEKIGTQNLCFTVQDIETLTFDKIFQEFIDFIKACGFQEETIEKQMKEYLDI